MKRFYYLSLGSNMGDSLNFLDQATLEIGKQSRLVAISADYRTDPWGYEAQAEFINRCLLIEDEREPLALLKLLQGIENALDRKRVLRWGPRTIDIDIIWVKGVSLNSDQLVIPHPRAFERAFVMVPLLDLPMVDPLLRQLIQMHLPRVGTNTVRKNL